MASVCILMATFNGERYLREQINSILTQSVTDWHLIVSDDGSSDGTIKILEEYVQCDERVRLVRRISTSPSPVSNFSKLIDIGLRSEHELFMFADQDDVWHKNKIAIMLHASKIMHQTPCLIHHDLEVVDKHLRTLAPSFIRWMKLTPCKPDFLKLLARNEVTGCTIMCNRALLELACPIPSTAIMHDWWLALFAAATGYIQYIPSPLIKYRQHTHNTLGASSFWSGLSLRKNWLHGWAKGNREFIATIMQGKVLSTRLKEHYPSPKEMSELLLYSHLLEHSRLKRLSTLIKCKFHHQHWFLFLVALLRIILIPRRS